MAGEKRRHRKSTPIVFGALASILVALAGYSLEHALQPGPGKPIATKHYDVNLDVLRDSRRKWSRPSESVHEAAGELAATFVQSSRDDSLELFLQDCAALTATTWGKVSTYGRHQVSRVLERYFGWSWPDAAGFTLKGPRLYVASKKQFHILAGDKAFVGAGNLNANGQQRLLDIGSGTGSETVKLMSALGIKANHVSCLETSSSMRNLLKARGFNAPSSFGELDKKLLFSTAALLNVLDRCDDPEQLLQNTIGALAPNGHLIVATVLPFSALVHQGSFGRVKASRKPHFPLSLDSTKDAPKSFELGAATFLDALLRTRRLKLVRWTRLPYVSCGNTYKTHFILDIAVMTLRLID